MSNLNKVMLIGRLGADPEVRATPSGAKVVNFRMATSENWKDKSGNRQERTEWHQVVAWGFQAEFAEKYLSKGRLVYVEGRLQTRDWEKDGVKHYRTEVVANTVQGLDRPGDSGGGGGGSGGGGRGGYENRGGQGGGQGGGRGRDNAPKDEYNQGPPPEEPYMEDDIPF